MEIGSADSAKLNTLRVEGALAGKIIGGGSHSLHMLRLTMNYDYYHNTAFEYGGRRSKWLTGMVSAIIACAKKGL